MTVDFFTPNEQNSATVEFYLFSKELTSVINGEYIEHNGQKYQVVGQLVAEEPKKPHNAFVYPINQTVTNPLDYLGSSKSNAFKRRHYR